MQSASGHADATSSSASAIPCHHFSLADIQSATNNFDDERIIGQGGFGKVYKGSISIEDTNHVVAIKRLDSMSNQGAPEFKAEIGMLSRLRHCHLVSLIGFCDDNKEMILVYEYMPHGTLYDHLHKAATPLTWAQRLKIGIGAARGLDYLHTGFGTHQGVIHRDVKSSNILLDVNWEAMISDFGLSKIGPTNQPFTFIEASVKGTFGYLDPEFYYTRQLTRKTDVYAFGVVLFELLSGRLPVDTKYGQENCSLVRWAQKCVKNRKVDQMVDSSICGIFPKCVRQFVQIAYPCLSSVPKERPTMTEVVASLQALLKVHEKLEVSSVSSSTMGLTSKILKTGASINAAFGRIARGTKALAEGGYESIFLQTFESVPDENLLKYYSCYLSTSAGPVMGILYMSTAKLAFRSDNPHSYKVGEKTLWSYYKVQIPLYQFKTANFSRSKANPAEKYIQIISVDNNEFWFMGFVNYDSAVRGLQGPLYEQYHHPV